MGINIDVNLVTENLEWHHKSHDPVLPINFKQHNLYGNITNICIKHACTHIKSVDEKESFD